MLTDIQKDTKTQMKLLIRYWTTLLLLTVLLSYCALSQKVILTSVNVYALKTRATYSCSAAHAIGARWYLNGTHSRELNLTNTTDFFFNETNVGIFLFLYLTGVYNNTHIQCEALFPSGPPERSGNNKTLRIQGYLSTVGNLQYSLRDETLILTWEAPFSLDIPRIDVDVKYCVTITSSSNELIHSECELENTRYQYQFNSSSQLCAVHTATVIPVNIVGDGARSSIRINYINNCVCNNICVTGSSAPPNGKDLALWEAVLYTAIIIVRSL